MGYSYSIVGHLKNWLHLVHCLTCLWRTPFHSQPSTKQPWSGNKLICLASRVASFNQFPIFRALRVKLACLSWIGSRLDFPDEQIINSSISWKGTQLCKEMATHYQICILRCLTDLWSETRKAWCKTLVTHSSGKLQMKGAISDPNL